MTKPDNLSLDIRGLEDASQILEFGSVYAFGTTTLPGTLALLLASPSLDGAHPVIYAENEEKVFDALEGLPEEFLRKSKTKIRVLKSDRDYFTEMRFTVFRSEPGAALIFTISTELLEDIDEERLTVGLHRISRVAADRDILIIVVCCGENLENWKRVMLSHQRELSGAAVVKSEKDSLLYNVHFWETNDSHIGASSFELGMDKDLHFFAEKIDDVPVSSADAAKTVSCQGAPGEELPEETTKYLPTNKEVYEEGLKLYDGTVIFVLHSQAEAAALARLIYDLRRKRGRQLKIHVIEAARSVRSTEEELLIACGANLVFQSTSTPQYRLAMISAFRRASWQLPIHRSFDDLLHAHFKAQQKGTIPLETFKKDVRESFEHTDPTSPFRGVLLKLSPHPDVKYEDIEKFFRPNRSGDIGTYASGAFFVFFPGCSVGSIQQALSHTFKVGIDQLFVSLEIIRDYHAFEEQLEGPEAEEEVQNRKTLAAVVASEGKRSVESALDFSKRLTPVPFVETPRDQE